MTNNKTLIEIDNKSKAIINLGEQLSRISNHIDTFDLFLISALNRTVNINKAFTSLIRDKNFIAAAPLVRINIDTLLRLYASIISEYDRNEFAKKVMSGFLIKNMKVKGGKEKLSDYYLHTEISKVENMDWVSKIYKVGNSFIHLENAIIQSSSKIIDEEKRQICFTIGFHDGNVPLKEKEGAISWMNKITDSIIEQAQIYMLEKSNKYDFDIEELNNI